MDLVTRTDDEIARNAGYLDGLETAHVVPKHLAAEYRQCFAERLFDQPGEVAVGGGVRNGERRFGQLGRTLVARVQAESGVRRGRTAAFDKRRRIAGGR